MGRADQSEIDAVRAARAARPAATEDSSPVAEAVDEAVANADAETAEDDAAEAEPARS